MNLNPEQQEAVFHVEGPLLVLAGAGSGKTGIVTHRIAHLIRIGVPPAEILALTFTNRAAEEMRHRIRQLTNQSILACTFHSLGARILRESIHHLGYKNDFSIYDENDSESLLSTCLDSLGYKVEKGTIRSLHNAISEAKNNLLAPNEVQYGPQDALFKEIYPAYQQKLQEYNALDFDDLLYLVIRLFQNHPDVLSFYQKRFSFVLVDEYQDTNNAQYILVKSLTALHRNLCVVGDPDQSIYSWRGANIQNILHFKDDYPDVTIIKLEQNYRSTETILKAANALIHHNTQRYEKNLWSTLGEGEKIRLFFARNELEEAEFVISEILKRKIPLEDTVIFYRTNAQSRVLEDSLIKKKLPYVIIGGLSFYQRREIKDIIALLRLVISGTDFLSFSRVINLPKRGFGDVSLQKLREAAERRHIPIIDLCYELTQGAQDVKLSKRQFDGLIEFIGLVYRLRQSSGPLKEQIIDAIELSRYLDYLKEDPETFHERKENLDELIAKAAEWGEDATLPSFLEELSLKSNVDELGNSFNSIKLMTFHNGKGLEFPLVFMVGMEEDLFPHVNSIDSIEGLEEERRLCYVGMTRAKKHLYLTSSTYRTIWGTPRVMRPSRFLGEIPPEYIEPLNNTTEQSNGDLEEGSSVFHKTFGTGVVQRVYNTSLGITYDVYFYEDETTRSLAAKYAKLITN